MRKDKRNDLEKLASKSRLQYRMLFNFIVLVLSIIILGCAVAIFND